MAFASNIAAINAARKQFGQGWKASATIEKLDGQWHVQLIQIEPRDLIGCLVSEREGAFTFPMAADMPAYEPEAAALDLTAEAMAEQQRAADAIANAQASEQNLPNGKVWVRKSSIEKPTKRVWDIADEMVRAAREAGQPMPSRKEVQDECVRRGIASGTARTQYQAWKKACDEAAANAAKAAALSAQFNRS